METPNQDHIEYIERYLNNKLPDQERITFEAKLESSKELREQVEWVRNLPDFLFSMEKERLTEQVKTWIDDKTPEDQGRPREAKQKSINSFSRSLKIVASLAATFLLISLAWLFFLKQDKTPVQQANDYIALYHSAPLILRGQQSEAWQGVIQLYKKRDFGNMIESMSPLVNKPTVSLEQLFYIGLAHLYTTPPSLDSTLYYFSLNIQKDSITYKEDIDWYSSLIYIKQGKLEKAQTLLSSIQASTSKYKDNANILLRSLSKPQM